MSLPQATDAAHAMPIRAERAAMLSGSALWDSPYLSATERHALSDAVSWSRRMGANRDVFREREEVDTLFLVTAGWACRYTIAAGGGRQITAVLLPGDVANLDALLLPIADCGLRTLTETTVVAFSRDRLVALSAEHPGIARTFTWLALMENAMLGRAAYRLGRQSAGERLAHFLCELCVRQDMEREDGTAQIPFPITQEQVADVLGLTAVHVNRTLQLLRAEGLIDRIPAMMRICDIRALRRAGGFSPAYLYRDRIAIEVPA